jgi:hypothetical protein
MELDDIAGDSIGPAVGVTAAVAALFAPPVRRALRRTAVYGLAGLLTVGGGMAAFFRPGAATERQLDTAFVRELADEARAERVRLE